MSVEDLFHVSEQVQLQQVQLSNQLQLHDLMMRIYRPVYSHLWYDDGSGYVDSQFNIDNLTIELNDQSAHYYFVNFNNTAVGILRFQLDRSTPTLEINNTTKLHRIYLNPDFHGHGLGKRLMQWTEDTAKTHGQQLVWLEAMDTQQHAIDFYNRCGYRHFEDFMLDAPTMRPEKRGMVRMCKQI
jgi:GNAT superfamily N-acetyltransferase